MADPNAVTIEGENYEVVDECMEDDEPSNQEESQITDSMDQRITSKENVQEEEEAESKKEESSTLSNTGTIPVEVITLQNNAGNAKVESNVAQTNDDDVKTDASIPEREAGSAKGPREEKDVTSMQEVVRDTKKNNELERKDCNKGDQIMKIENTESKKDTDIPDIKTGNAKDNQNSIQEKEETTSLASPIPDQDEDTKEMTDEDVMQHLDVIENIVLDPSTFGEECTTEKLQECEEKESTNQNSDVKWYEQKLAQKESTIRERLSKLARVLEYSYPHYKKWLDMQEKQHGSPICKLNPARRCPLDKPYSNRWKFLCSRKSVQESTKDGGSADVTGENKNVETIWRLQATTTWGVNTENHSEFPPFVMRAVKVFEEFLQTTEVKSETSEISASDKDSDDVVILNDKEKDEDDEYLKEKQEWLWLVVRCNSMDHLMLFATGKFIRRSTMDQLKQVFETGPGKDCNVKSLYCKSINKVGDTTVSNTTFLVGSEALDEIVGGLKIQLAPKTNFWSNTAGAENIAKAVADLLLPNATTTVLEIGCGIGLIGLMLASKCQKIIGVDSPSEVEEAEMTCELNNIKNVSFIMGSPNEVINKITSTVKSRKTYAIINANTNIGRAITLMTALRKVNSIRRIVMITTLTKQSVRAILELTRPGDRSLGLPFMPIQACVVDTLPVGPHFEIVIRMERRMMHKYLQVWKNHEIIEQPTDPSISHSEESPCTPQEKVVINTAILKKGVDKPNEPQGKKNLDKSPLKGPANKKAKMVMPAKKGPMMKNVQTFPNVSYKAKFIGKRLHSPENLEVPPKKMIKKFDKGGVKNWRPDLAAKKNPQLRLNPLYEKKMREHREQSDLRERLSGNRIDPQIVQTVKEHQALLAVAKEKLSGPAPTVDVTTAKELQTMLNTILEQANKLQNQLPRSVWDRIAPPESEKPTPVKGVSEEILKDRYVQETSSQDILITTTNRKFGNEAELNTPAQKKYHNIPPLEPDLIAPTCRISSPDVSSSNTFTKQQPNRYFNNKPQNQSSTWNREKPFERSRWNDSEQLRKPTSPMRRQLSPPRHRASPLRRFSPKRPMMNLPMRQNSPPRRHISPPRRASSPFGIRTSPSRRPISPQRRPMSPPRRPMSPMMMRKERMDIMPVGRQPMILERPRISSPPALSINQRRPQSPPRRPMSPPRKFNDEWDIPSRGAVEQNMWRPAERIQEKPWCDERQSLINTQPPVNDRFRKPINQDKWDISNTSPEDREPILPLNRWIGGGESWKKQQQMQQNSESGWMSGPGPSKSTDNWNIRGKDSFGKPPNIGSTNNRDEWMDKNSQRWDQLQNKDVWNKTNEKDDWNDLPEDARDPWAEEGNLGWKDNNRWSKGDNPIASSTWIRESDKAEFWPKPADTWQNKNQQHPIKPSQWAGNNQNTNKSRWISGNDTRHQNEMQKKSQHIGGWQTGSSVGSWPTQTFNYQQTRPFNMNPFKDRH